MSLTELKKGRVSGSAPPVDICMKSKVIVQKGRMRAISEASEFSVSPNPLPAGIHVSLPPSVNFRKLADTLS